MPHQRMLGTFTLAMIAVVAVIDLRSSAMMASYGLSSIFFYSAALLFFLIPIGFVCAELATTVHEPGGMYVWIHTAFGDKTGFVAIWLEWINNLIAFPASLSFICVTLLYLVDPQLAHHKILILWMTLATLWLMTGFTLLGIRASSRLNRLGGLLGTILPAIIIVLLACVWVFMGKPVQITLDWQHLLPDLKNSNPGFFAAIILGFGGMQLIAFHSANVASPRHSYPRAIFFAIVIIFLICSSCALGVAMVIPHAELNLISGFIESFMRFFGAFNMPWASPILILLIVFGMLATFNAWFLGPARGLAVAAANGFIPKILARVNKHDVPGNILLMQAILCSFFSLLFLAMPDLNAGFWILINLSSQSALMVYILIFLSALKLRLNTRANPTPGYRIPGGTTGIWLVAGTGSSVCALALTLSLIPPDLVHTGSLWSYELILVGCNLLFIAVPLIILRMRRIKQ
jgi:amino acid transporter